MTDSYDSPLGEIAERLGELQQNVRADKLIPKDMYAARLLDYYTQLSVRHEFKPGDLVQEKSGLGSIITMEAGYPAIITRVYNERQHQHDAKHSTDGTYHDCNMLILGSKQAVEVCAHTSKLEPYTGPVYRPGTVTHTPVQPSVWASGLQEQDGAYVKTAEATA
jgi:hypothetical protein